MRKHSPAIHGAFEGLQSSVWPETPQRDRAQQNNRTGANIMNGKGEPKLIFPGLAGFYAAVSDLWYPMIRFAIGAILFMHGYAKVANIGIGRVATNFGTNYGLPMPNVLAYSAVFLETVGAICIAIGLFTRFFAAAIAIELLIAMLAAHWVKGFSVSAGGYEYVLFLGIVMFAIALRGGGPYSVDRVIGKEL
jgi:putative oxidoreductase